MWTQKYKNVDDLVSLPQSEEDFYFKALANFHLGKHKEAEHYLIKNSYTEKVSDTVQ